MKSCFELVCLFGFSPHFLEIANFLDNLGINCVVVFGPRQKDAINCLSFPKSVEKLCLQSLDDDAFKQIKVQERESLGISFGSPFIFTQENIDCFGGRLINSHGAPLPDFKGGGGFSWRILQRDKRGSTLMHYVTTKIDEGACAYRRDFLFSDDERMPRDFEKRQLKEECEHLVPWIKNIILGKLLLEKQSQSSKIDHVRGTYYPRLSSDLHGCIDWSLNLLDLQSFVLAFSNPYPGAYTFCKGLKVRLMDFRIERTCFVHPFAYGIVVDVGSENFMVSCNGGIISVMHDDFCCDNQSFSLKSGDRFFTPEPILQKAFASRVFYTPNGLKTRDYSQT